MTWLEEHPTHYDWAPHVQAIVDDVVSWYFTAANTYYDHPTWQGLDHVSVDFWGMGGRGDTIPWETGQAIADYVVSRAGEWGLKWIIWYGYENDGPSAWDWFTPPWDGSDDFAMHWDHVHCTFAEEWEQGWFW